MERYKFKPGKYKVTETESQGDKGAQEKDIKIVAQKIVKRIESETPDLFLNISEDQKEKLAEKVISLGYETKSFSYEEHHTGPLPAPKTLKAYDSIINNGAERIMQKFEQQSSHRQYLEKTVIVRQLNQSSVGQILGFVVALCCLGIGCFLVMKGHDAAGITIFSLDIVGLVSVFVIRKIYRQRELEGDEG